MSIYEKERESLLAPGTTLKVLGRTRTGSGEKKVTEIRVREVGSALQ